MSNVKLRRRTGATSAGDGPRVRRSRRPSNSQMGQLFEGLRNGVGRVRSCDRSNISIADFQRLWGEDPGFRDAVYAAELVPDETVREALFLLAASGTSMAAISAFLDIRRRDVELRILVERHEREMRDRTGAGPATVAKAMGDLVAKLAGFIPAERHPEVLRCLAESIAAAESRGGARDESWGEAGRGRSAIPLPYWSEQEELAVGCDDEFDGMAKGESDAGEAEFEQSEVDATDSVEYGED
jgi:hypothetical protein